MAEGFYSGLAEGNQALLGEQSGQLQNALAIANQINGQRLQEHNMQMQELQNQLAQRHADTYQQQADTMEQYRKSSEERQTAAEHANEVSKAYEAIHRLADVGGVPYGAALSHLQKIDPDEFNTFTQQGLGGLNMRRKAAWDAAHPQGMTAPQPQPTDTNAPVAMPAPQQTPAPTPTPTPDLSQTLGLPMLAGSPSMGPGAGMSGPSAPQSGPAPSGQPMMPPDNGQAMGLPMLAAQAAQGPSPAAPMVGAPLPAPMAGPMPDQSAPPGTPAPGAAMPAAPQDQYVPATMDDFLASQSPAFVMAQEKEKAKQQDMIARRRNQEITANAAMNRAAASQTLANARQEISDVERERFNQRLGTKNADWAAHLQAMDAIKSDQLDELASWHDTLKDLGDAKNDVASKNADTNRMNAVTRKSQAQASPKLLDTWRKFDYMAKGYETDADKLNTLANKAAKELAIRDEAMATAHGLYDKTLADQGDTDPLTAIARDKWVGEQQKYAAAKAANNDLQMRAAKKAEEAKGYRALASNMGNDLAAKGLIPTGDGKGFKGSVPRFPPGIKPAAGQPGQTSNTVMDAAKSLGIIK